MNCVTQMAQNPSERVLVRPRTWGAISGSVTVFNVTVLVRQAVYDA